MEFGLFASGMVLPGYIVTIFSIIVANNPLVGTSRDCLEGDGSSYTGWIAMTESGYYCKSWIPDRVSS